VYEYELYADDKRCIHERETDRLTDGWRHGSVHSLLKDADLGHGVFTVAVLVEGHIAVSPHDDVGHDDGHATGPVVRLLLVLEDVLADEEGDEGQSEHEARGDD